MEIPLSRLRGEDIADAALLLGPCGPTSPATAAATVDAAHVGRVRITFERKRRKRGKAIGWYWLMLSAELLEHVCDRKGPSTKVIDETGDEPITAIHGSCSVCGKPQIPFDQASRRPEN